MFWLRNLLRRLYIFLLPMSIRKSLYSCKDVAELLASPDPLTFKQKFFLNLHLLICNNCVSYKGQLGRLGEFLRDLMGQRLEEEKKEVHELEEKIVKKYIS